MKKRINGKTYNTKTSKKVCGYVVNDWTHELYQSKSGEYFTYIYNSEFCVERLRLVSKGEVSHMMERSGLVSGNKKVTVLKGLEPWSYDEENQYLKVTGKGGLIKYDFGSWEVTVDIDDKNWVKMTPKGKSVFNQSDLNIIEEIRCTDWKGSIHNNRWIKDEYLYQRFGNY